MEQNTTTINIKVYRDGQLSRWETYKPVIWQQLVSAGRKIDYFFVNGRWPAGADTAVNAD